MRVDFRPNRQVRRRRDDWTRRYRAEEEQLEDAELSESVRAKGELSRRRTILVDQANLPAVEEEQWRRGTVTRVLGLFAHVSDEQGQSWECTVRRVLRTLLIKSRSPITVGDRVWFSDQSKLCGGQRIGVIERVEERTTRLSRRHRQREHTIVANVDQLLAVVSVAQPRLRPHLLDRYIVAAIKGRLRPVLCFNKIDLLDRHSVTEDDDERQSGLSVQEVIDEFRNLGYCCICTSAITGVGLDALREALKDRTTVLAGQSGVGKSSLLNALQPGLNLVTREVSRETEKGRHATSTAQLLPLDFGGFVVDTPGIRAFDLWEVAPGELEACFVEFIPYIPQCRFSDCSHRYEEGCAVIAAVEAGQISRRRYYSYLKMFEEV